VLQADLRYSSTKTESFRVKKTNPTTYKSQKMLPFVRSNETTDVTDIQHRRKTTKFIN